MNPQQDGFKETNTSSSTASSIPSAAQVLSSDASFPYAIARTNTSHPLPPMPSYNSTFSPADLKWHNTLPEDFTGGQKLTISRTRSPVTVDSLRKHPSGTFENIDAILQSHVHHTAASPTLLSPLPPTHRLGSSPLPSPIKRPRASQRNTPAKTPTKSKPSNSLTGSGSGMQTPPPSSTTTARKRGRPSKKLYPVLPANNNGNRDSLTQQSPPQTSPTKLQKLNGSQSCHNLGSEPDPQSKFTFQQFPGSDILMPSDEPRPNFYQKCNNNLWPSDGGDFDFIAGLTTANSNGLEHSASFDWSPPRNNASLDNLNHTVPTDIFTPTPELRRQQSQSSLLTDEGTSSADNPTFSFLQFDDPYGLEMPLDVDPNLLVSSNSNSAASSMIGGFREEFKPFPCVQQQQQPYQPYQHQHLQQLREQKLEMQKQKQLQERLLKERSRREHTIAASGGRHSRHSGVLKHSMSDGILTGPEERQVCKAANFNAAVLKRSCSNAGRRGETVLVDHSYTPSHSQRAYNPTHPSGLRRSTLKIQEKPPRTRTEVFLAISPGGRAKTETKIVYDNSDIDIDIEEPLMWDSPQESDSSFDDDVPRGLGPDGIDYALFRQRKAADPFQGAKPTRTVIVPSYENQNQPPPQPPRTPTRRSPLKMPLSGGSHRKMNDFPTSTTAGTTSISGRLDSSPRLPTPLRSSPPPVVDRRVRERVRRASLHSLTPSQSMSAIGTPRLGSMREVSDESEAETVVNGTDICILDDEENGDAMYALKVMVARRNGEASRVTSLQCTPTKAHPASASKPQTFSTGSSIGTCSSGRHNQMHPQLLRPSPVNKKLFEEQILRTVDRQRNGYEHQMTDDTPTTPTKRRTRAMERKEMLENPKNATRCICGEKGDSGGKALVQCDTCHHSLHMKCVGYTRKSLPEFFECNFCKNEVVEQENIPKYRGRTRSRRAIRVGSDDENNITSLLIRNGR